MVKNLVVKIENTSIQKCLNKKGIQAEIGQEIEIENWEVLKSTAIGRKLPIEVVCDECGLSRVIEVRRAKNDGKDLCASCAKIGDKNPSYGKPSVLFKKVNDEIKAGIRKNNFAIPELNKKAVDTKRRNGSLGNSMRDKKHSSETKLLMSKVRIEGLADGTIPFPQGWRSQLSSEYKGMHCQSSYEVDFLKHAESLGKLHLIERGPIIAYYCNTEKKMRKYLVDFSIKDTNILIEVKSTWVLNNHLENYNDKKQSTINKNYNLLLVLDKNYLEIDKILKNG